VASTLNTKITSLGEKIALPKFGPQPALAGAGGRGSSVFEMTPGTRNGPAGSGMAARLGDPASATGPVGGAGAFTRAGGGSALDAEMHASDSAAHAPASSADAPSPGDPVGDGTSGRTSTGGSPAGTGATDGGRSVHQPPTPDTFDPTDGRDYPSGDPRYPGDSPHSPKLTYAKGSSEPGWGLTSRGSHQPWMDYQEQITGIQRTPDGKIPEYHAFRSDGSPVAFDGHTFRGSDEVFLDAKDGYRGLAFNPEVGRFRGMRMSSVDKALRQLDALPEGARLEWHVSDPHGAAALRQLMIDRGINDLSIVYTLRP